MIKICHLSRLHSLGGVQRSLASFIKATVNQYDLDQELITGSELHPYIREQIISTGIPVHYFARFHRWPVPKYPLQIRRWYLARLLKKVKPKTLVMWDYSNDYHVVAAAHKLGIRVLYFERSAAWGYKNRKSRRRVFDMVDGVLCNSNAAKRVLELEWNLRQPIIVCRNALRVEMQPDTVQAKKFPTHRAIRIGIAGRLEMVKAFGLAIRACELLLRHGYEVSLHIAGDGRQRADLEKLAEKLGIAEHCIFLGSIQDMPGFFQHVDICLVPSFYEPFGLVSIEAQAWGCVTLVAGVDGLAETVIDNQTGSIIKPTLPLDSFPETHGLPGQSERFYYDPQEDDTKPICILDPQDIFKMVKALIENPSKFESMSRLGSRRVLFEFGFKKHIRKIIKGIQSLS